MKVLSVSLFRLLAVSQRVVGITSVLGIVLISSVEAQEIKRLDNKKIYPSSKNAAVDLTLNPEDKSIREQKEVSTCDRSVCFGQKNAKSNIAQVITKVKGIQINQTESGLELVLETVAGSERLVPLILSAENNLEIDILDATLGFPIRNGVTELNPVAGIDRIELRQVDESSIRLTISGSNQTPSAEIVPSRQNLVLRVTSEQTTARQQNEPKEIINIVVTEVGTRTETDPLDVPQTVQVIPREIIENREVNDVSEALESIPGFTPSLNTFLGNTATIRGFDVDFRRNGLNNPFFGDAVQTANIEKIEILKGPASVLYGQGSFGGTVNVVTKKPTDEPFYKIDAAVGNFDLYRGAIDFSGPLDESKSVKYRLNIAAETEGSFIDDIGRDRLQVSPVVSWEIGKNTDITFALDYSNLTADNNFGLPARGTVLDNINGEIDTSRYIGDADEETREVDTLTVGYELEHRFSNKWRINNAFQFTRRTAPEFTISGLELEDDQRTLLRDFFDVEKFDINSYLLDTYVVGNFNTGSVKHELLAGIELARADSADEGNFGDTSSIDLFAPELDNTTFDPPLDEFLSESTNESLGIYVQDKVEFTDSLILLAGIRFDIASTRFEDLLFNEVDFDQEEEFSPRVGIVYKIIPEVALYTSYSRSFTPNSFERSSEGESFPPQRGTQFEVGTKAQLNQKIGVTLAYFNTTISNVTTSDPEDAFFSVITGEQNSEGVELFATGEILPGWSVIGGYTYNDAEVTEDNDIEVGNRLPNVPEHAFSLLTNYEIQQGNLKGLGGSLGIYFVGDRQGDFDNSFEVPSYTRTDASIFYKREKFRTAVNFRNLFDIEYFQNAEDELRVRYGEPFTVVGSVSYEF